MACCVALSAFLGTATVVMETLLSLLSHVRALKPTEGQLPVFSMPSDIIPSVKLPPLSADFIVLDRAQAEFEVACPDDGAVCSFTYGSRQNELSGCSFLA